MSDRNLLNREQIQNIGMASAHMRNALENACTLNFNCFGEIVPSLPYLDESSPLTGNFSDYATESIEPRYECHTDNRSFDEKMGRIRKNLGEVFKYRNGRIEGVDLDAFYRDCEGIDNES